VVQPLEHPLPQDILAAEVERLRTEGGLLCAQHHFEVYISEADRIPNILRELGRLREQTFRSVGEGTNRSLDLDAFDPQYQHLFLWDRQAGRIAGAYRLGEGHKLIARQGKSGFYLSTLFHIDDALIPVMERAVELGRSFVCETYQQQRLPLFLLWRGILCFLERHPRYRYLMGPVSISNQYSKISRSLIVAFLRKYCYHEAWAQLVRPRKPFRPVLRKLDFDSLLEGNSCDLRQMDRIIADIEPAHFRLPVLLKKYLKQNARIIGFNIDPAFNQCLDGFMVMDLKDLPELTRRQYQVQALGEM
jgi:putative hemolysin